MERAERPALYAWFVEWEHQMVPTPSPLDAPSGLMSTAEGQTEAAFPLSFMASSSSPGLSPTRALQADVEEIPAFLAIPCVLGNWKTYHLEVPSMQLEIQATLALPLRLYTRSMPTVPPSLDSLNECKKREAIQKSILYPFD
jgi:hypothetical protein